MSQTKHWPAEHNVETHYLKAAQEWDNRIGSAVVQAKNWRLLAFGLIGVIITCLIGLIYLGSQTKVESHIIEFNNDTGEAKYIGIAGTTYQNFSPSEAAITHHLRRFIDNIRTISSDAKMMNRAWSDAYTQATTNAQQILTTAAQKQSPYDKAKFGRSYVTKFIAEQPISDNSWQVEWIEEKRSTKGALIGSERWRGVFTIVTRQPTTQEQMIKNPIGLYIHDFNWSLVKPE